MSILWIIPRMEPVPAIQWTGFNADELISFTSGEFFLEVASPEEGIGILGDAVVPLGHYIVQQQAGTLRVMSPEEIRSHYEIA